MKNLKYFKLIFSYLKEDRFKIVIYVLLLCLGCIQSLFYPVIWSTALASLMAKEWNTFFVSLSIWSAIGIMFNVILQLPRDYLFNYLQIKFSKNVSKDLYYKLQNLPAIAFEDIGSGELLNRLYQDPDRVIDLLAKLIKLLIRFVVVIIVITIGIRVSWIIGLELLLFAVTMFIFSKYYFPRIKKTQEEIKKESDSFVKRINQTITGIREIKSLGIKKIVREKIYDNVDTLFAKQRKIFKTETNYYILNNLAYFLLQFLILITCGYLYYKGQISFAIFMMMEMYIWRIDEAIANMSDFGVSYNKVAVSLKRIDEIVNNKLYKDVKFGKKELIKPKGVIEFKKVKFHYRKNEPYILSNFSMKIPPHKKVAIVGKSGMGKTTIFNILLRYFDVSDGNVFIDNINIKDISEKALRDNISIISQTPFLFNKTIFENFQIVKEDITMKEVREVCKRAYIDEYIESLPKRYDTVIGEGGINLSGGQKQRIAIARTLIKNTKIILFDEATSALDNESQEYIKNTIDGLVKDHTIIIVAHRLSTIIDADIILVVDKGEVVDQGSHKELLQKCTEYRSLYSPELIDVE